MQATEDGGSLVSLHQSMNISPYSIQQVDIYSYGSRPARNV